VSIKLLKTFLAIHQSGSFALAAERVFVTRAAVGQQMSQLESLFQCELFDRSFPTPKMNQKAIELIPSIEEAVYKYDTLFRVPSTIDRHSGKITVGAVSSALFALLPLAIKSLKATSSDVHVKVIPSMSDDLYDYVLGGSLDVAIISKPKQLDKKLKWRPLVEEELVLMTSLNIETDDPKNILKSNPYLRLARRTSVGLIADEWLTKNKIRVNESMVIDTMESLCNMVAHDLGVSIAPNPAISSPVFSKLKKIPLGRSSYKRKLGMIALKSNKESVMAERLFEHLEKVIHENQ
jgi:DNA-binding transcriptional LysR family regulator